MLNFPKLFLPKILPWTCLLCHGPSDQARDLCSPCQKYLPAYHNGCPQCGVKMNTPGYILPCGRCLQTPPPFHATHILFAYASPVTHLLTRLKFHHHLTAARVFGELFIEQIRDNWYRDQRLPDIILPVPLHPRRLRERGYNQTLEIARPIAKRLALPLWHTVCARIRPTLPQTTLPASARRANVRNAFAVTGSIQGLHIAVLEDVITTGSTINALCQALQKGGARRIDVWCCAQGVAKNSQDAGEHLP